jgi:hypothetical protein
MVVRRTLSVVTFLALALAVPATLAGAQQGAKVSFDSPTPGSTVAGPAVEVRLRIENFTAVAAGSPVRDGEGHAHLFVDREPMNVGATIPADQPNIVHLGKAPFDSRSVDLEAGQHTLRVQLGDSSHRALDVAPASVTFTVGAAGTRPSRAPAAGDGSLAGTAQGSGPAIPIAGGAVAVLAAAGLLLRRRRASRS